MHAAPVFFLISTLLFFYGDVMRDKLLEYVNVVTIGLIALGIGMAFISHMVMVMIKKKEHAFVELEEQSQNE